MLGDRSSQEAIRAENPDGTHCFELIQSPNACDGCPKNPSTRHEREDEQSVRLAEEYKDMIAHADLLSSYAEIGCLPPIDRISPADALIARIAWEIRLSRRQKDLSIRIGNELNRNMNSLIDVFVKAGLIQRRV